MPAYNPADFSGPDTTREYTTRSGDRVILHDFVPYNSPGDVVTFPIKGIIIAKNNPRRKRADIWTLEGRSDIFGLKSSDIIDLPPVLLSPAPGCVDCAGSNLRT